MKTSSQPTIDLEVARELTASLPENYKIQNVISEALDVIISQLAISIEPYRVELSVNLTTDPVIRSINKKYRGIDSPTDVLSFPLIENLDFEGASPDGNIPVSFGDIVISMETVEKQAEDRGITVMERFTECFVHGILHLLGYDHIEENERIRMEWVEDELIPHLIEKFRSLDWAGKLPKNG